MGPKTSAGKCQPDWQDLMEEGVYLRETGNREDLKKSIAILLNAAEAAESEATKSDKMKVLNHLGLAYFHRGDYTNAVDTWKLVYTTSKVQKPPLLDRMAESLRHRSRKELCETEKDFEDAVGKANEAREIAVNLSRSDLPWFTHGLFSAKLAHMKSQKRYDELVLKELVKIEKNELVKVWKKVSKLERRVWLGGFLMDYAVVYNKVSKPLLKVARLLSSFLKLRRREEQIGRLLNNL